MPTRLIVEWTRSSLRLARADGSCLRAIHSQPVRAPGELAGALQQALKAIKAGTAQAIGVVSREQVITRAVRFPSTEPGELAQMVELYARAQLPYPREQMVVDFHVLQQRDGHSTVAVVACQREVIDRHLAVFREAGLPLRMLTVSSWGVLGWYRQLRRTPALTQQGAERGVPGGSIEEPSLVVNIDDTRTDLVLLSGEQVLSSRSLGQGANDWSRSGDVVELLALEVERSRAAIRRELPGTEVRSLILTGLGELSRWEGILAQRVQLPVRAQEGLPPLRPPAGVSAPAMSPVVIGGLASSEPGRLLNLTPPEIRIHAQHRQQVRELVMVSALLAGVLAAGSALLALQAGRQQRLAAQLDHALAELEPVAKQLKAQHRLAQLVTTVRQNQRQVVAVLADLFRATPAAITLEWLTFERARRELILRGNALTTQDVLGYLKQLEQVAGVGRVELQYTTARVTGAGERTDFQLLLHLREGPPHG
ncbi:MAG: pilus assembly protein PilM [Candidatus Omnitrophota bacterium]|nr:pilus assembly protein PilM [Candidatus Omnitrophota bacterium]